MQDVVNHEKQIRVKATWRSLGTIAEEAVTNAIPMVILTKGGPRSNCDI